MNEGYPYRVVDVATQEQLGFVFGDPDHFEMAKFKAANRFGRSTDEIELRDDTDPAIELSHGEYQRYIEWVSTVK